LKFKLQVKSAARETLFKGKCVHKCHESFGLPVTHPVVCLLAVLIYT